MQPASPAPAAATNPIDLMLHSSGMVLVVLLLLIIASFAVWVIWFLKSFQLGRLRAAQNRFEYDAGLATTPEQLLTLATQHPEAPGARVVMELGKRQKQQHASTELLTSVREFL